MYSYILIMYMYIIMYSYILYVALDTQKFMFVLQIFTYKQFCAFAYKQFCAYSALVER